MDSLQSSLEALVAANVTLSGVSALVAVFIAEKCTSASSHRYRVVLVMACMSLLLMILGPVVAIAARQPSPAAAGLILYCSYTLGAFCLAAAVTEVILP
jgi:hypothetical protein